jgi:hypothetical protein
MNEFCLYLIYCCGTGKNHERTRWSVNALTKYTNIPRRAGKKAEANLITEGVVIKERDGKHPIFKLELNPDDEKVWLPNKFIMGAADEVPPLERLRQTGDPLILRLILDFYAESNLADYSGLPPSIVHMKYDKTKIAESGRYGIYGFNSITEVCYQHDIVVEPHNQLINDKLVFWSRLETIQKLGLIYFVPVLFDGDDGGIMFPLVNPFNHDELEDITLAAEHLLPDEYQHFHDKYEWILPITEHMPNATLKGIYVLRYRQQTSLTAAGMATIMESIDTRSNVFNSGSGYIKGTSRVIKGISRVSQG